jgi:alkylhydroperoxidase family enzyme
MGTTNGHPILGADQPLPLLAAEPPTGLEDEAKRKLGFVPKLVSFVAASPWLPRTMLDVITLKFSHADPGLTRLVKVIASYENACRYCYGTARAVLRMQGWSDAEIVQLEHDVHLAQLSEDTRAVLDFVRVLTRANPRPARDRVDSLVARGYDRLAVVEIAATAAYWCLGNRIATFLAIPSEDRMEAIPDSFLGKLLRPFIRRRLRRLYALVPAPASLGPVEVPYGGIVRALEGTPSAVACRDALAGAFASPILPRRAKALVFGVVARSLACGVCEAESRRVLVAEGVVPAVVDESLDHLASPDLDPLEGRLMRFARDTVRYRPAEVYERTRALRDEIGPARTLEAVGVAALANAVVRLAMLVT